MRHLDISGSKFLLDISGFRPAHHPEEVDISTQAIVPIQLKELTPPAIQPEPDIDAEGGKDEAVDEDEGKRVGRQ